MAEGIEVRHGKGCRSHGNGRCNCTPSYRVHLWSQRDRRRIRKSFRSLPEAKAWRADATVALRQGRLQAPSPMTLQEAADAYLHGMEDGSVRDRSGRTYKPSTIRTYRAKLRDYVLPALGASRLTEVRRRDVQDLADELLADGLSSSSIRNTIDPLRVIYRRAMRRDEVVLNPTENLDLPSPKRKKKIRIAPPQEARALLAAVPTGDRATWSTAFFAGLRRGEMQALRCSAVDFDKAEIRVERGHDQYEGEIDPKTNTSTRTVPLLAELRPYLSGHLLATGRRENDLVFGRTARDAFVPSTLSARADKAWQLAGLDRITLHDCRHTYASMLIASGANARTVMDVMGHSSITITFNTYGHLFPGNRDELRARVDAYLEAERGTTAGQ